MNNKALIVDDEPLAREVIKVWLAPHHEIELVGEAANGRAAVAAVHRLKPDLVFLDVQMPDLDGFGVVRKISAPLMPAIIFVTAYDRFAVRAFEVHALDYLLKPFPQSRFNEALNRALQQLTQRRPDITNANLFAWLAAHEERRLPSPQRISVKANGKIILLKTADVDWIEAAGDYVALHIGNKSHLIHETMNSLALKLNPSQFLRIHRSMMVNIERVRELHPHRNGEYYVMLYNGVKLKLSRNYRDNLQAWLGEMI